MSFILKYKVIILRTMMIDLKISVDLMFQLRKKRADLPLFKNQLRKAPTTNNNKNNVSFIIYLIKRSMLYLRMIFLSFLYFSLKKSFIEALIFRNNSYFINLKNLNFRREGGVMLYITYWHGTV